MASFESHPEDISSWIGTYEFFFFFSPHIMMGYGVTIYEECGVYYALIAIDGYQTMERVGATVRGNNGAIDLIFHSFYPDNIHERFKEEELILTFTKKDGEITTTWEGLQPITVENEMPGIYFELVQE
jgi:hypothetical protein